jgi:ABC-2 type transport system permease protein
MVGAVYDRGYRPYEGERGGRPAARSALFRASVRRALGLRRPWRQKVAPALLLAIAVVPAIVNVGVAYITRNTLDANFEFITYREYVGVSNALLVFVALTAPDIVCPDRRQRVLPLLFSRPLKGIDYVMAKVGAMFAILFAFSFLPQVLLFVGQMLVSADGALDYARSNAEVIWQVPAAVALLAIYYASIGVAVASLTSRRIIGGATIIGLFLVSNIVAAVLVGPRVDSGGSGRFFAEPKPSAAPLLDLLTLPLQLRDIVFLGHIGRDDPMSGLANGGLYASLIFIGVVTAALVTLVLRYNEVER